MATMGARAAFVEMGILTALGNEFSNLNGTDSDDAVAVALDAAAMHAHNTFRWSIELRQVAAAPAAAVAQAAIGTAVADATEARAAFYERVRAPPERPVVGACNVTVDGNTSHTSRAGAVVAIWDLEHPAHGFLSSVRAARLERPGATGVYTFLAATLSTDVVRPTAAKLSAQAAFLSNPATRKRRRCSSVA